MKPLLEERTQQRISPLSGNAIIRYYTLCQYYFILDCITIITTERWQCGNNIHNIQHKESTSQSSDQSPVLPAEKWEQLIEMHNPVVDWMGCGSLHQSGSPKQRWHNPWQRKASKKGQLSHLPSPVFDFQRNSHSVSNRNTSFQKYFPGF